MNKQDKVFLKSLDEDRNKFYYARIIVLDKDEKVIKSIEGRVLPGSSVSIDGNSSVRRTCNINLIAEEAENDLTNIENFLSINKKIRITVGIKREFDYVKDIYYFVNKSDKLFSPTDPFAHGFPPTGEKGKIYVDRFTSTYWKQNGREYQEISSIEGYENEIVWFPIGVFVINQPSLTHSVSGCTISLSCKDKMCLLNGEMGGNLPTSVTFHQYDQIIGEIECTSDPRTDSSIIPNDYTIYKQKISEEETKYYTYTKEYGWEESNREVVYYERTSSYGVKRTDGIPAGDVVSKPQLIYDIIQTVVANYGNESLSRIIINDVPTEIKQLVRQVGNNSLFFNSETGQYSVNEVDLSNAGAWSTFEFNEDVGYIYTDFTYPGSLITNIGDNVCTVLDKVKATLGNFEYFYDIDGNFVFQEIKNYLNNSYDPTEENTSGELITYYLDDIKAEAAIQSNSLCVIGEKNFKTDYYGDQGQVYTFDEGNNLITSYSSSPSYINLKNDYHIQGKNNDGLAIHYHLVIKDKPTIFQKYRVVFLKDEPISSKEEPKYNGLIRLADEGETMNVVTITPNDWRAELYLQGLTLAKAGLRPDIYQQELLNFFDLIYEWGYYNDVSDQIKEGRFKGDVYKPNELSYFIDYLEPSDNLYGISVDDIDTKIYSYQQDKIVRIYNKEVPNYVIIDVSMSDLYKKEVRDMCDSEGQPFSTIDSNIYSKMAIGTIGYSAQEVARDLLYQYSSYNESISFQSIPIYYLDVNKRVTIRDKKIGINGDYIIKNISLPLSPNNTMSVTATKALTRI